MSSKNKDFLGFQQKEKGRKRAFKQLLKSQDGFEDKSDPYKCKKRPWSEEEDLLVIKLVSEHGPQRWTFIATHLEGRIGKQCRERWHNHLNPNIKKCSWSEEEEWVLYLFHKGIGNKWAEIAKYIVGRTDNSIKNHWNSGMKKRLDDYANKLAFVREIFEEIGESYLNKITVAGEKKALEILLLNKPYVPSDCEDDIDNEDEGDIDEQTSQDENKNNNTLNINLPEINNSTKEINLKEELDSQKTKEKLSIQSKTSVNPFIWNKNDDELSVKNQSTAKKLLPTLQLIKHSQSLQPSHVNKLLASKENETFTPKGTSSSKVEKEDNTILSSILKENKNATNKQLVQKRSQRQGSPSLKEDPMKKVKLEESNLKQETANDKKKKIISKKENQTHELEQNQGGNDNSKTEKRKNKTSDISSTSQVVDGKYKYMYAYEGDKTFEDHCIYQNCNQQCCSDISQYMHYPQYPSIVTASMNSSEDKEYSQAYDHGQFSEYPVSYHPYSLQRGQSYPGYSTQNASSAQASYPTPYMGPTHPSNQSSQAYQYDPHYYAQYAGMNYMYYPSMHTNLQENSALPPCPSSSQNSYKQKSNSSANMNSQSYTTQIDNQQSSQIENSNKNLQVKNSHEKQQLSSQFNRLPDENILTLNKSKSIPAKLEYTSTQNIKTKSKNISQNQLKTKKEDNQYNIEQTHIQNSKLNQGKNTRNQMQLSLDNNKNYIEMDDIHQQDAYLSTMNSDYKYKQMDQSPFQIRNNSPCNDNNEKENNILESNQKINRNSILSMIGGNNYNLPINQSHISGVQGLNYESPSKMLNLSERVMLKTVSSNKFNINNLDSNKKYQIKRPTLNPLNLNTLFNQEEDLFNDNGLHQN